MSKEFIDALVGGDNLGAEKAFSITMSSRVGDALEFVNSSYIDQEADVNETD